MSYRDQLATSSHLPWSGANTSVLGQVCSVAALGRGIHTGEQALVFAKLHSIAIELVCGGSPLACVLVD